MWTPTEDDDEDEDAPPPPVDLAARRRARAAARGDEFDLAAWRADRARRREQREREAQLVPPADDDESPPTPPLDRDPAEVKAEQRRKWDAARERYRQIGRRARPWPDDGPLMSPEGSGYYRRPPGYITGDERREAYPFSRHLT